MDGDGEEAPAAGEAPAPEDLTGVRTRLSDAIDLLPLADDDLPKLREAERKSLRDLDDARNWLVDRLPIADAEEVDVVVLGSYARLEATFESDFDYLVIPHGLTESVTVHRELLRAVDSFIIEKLFGKRPGGTGLFGQIVSAPDLVERIGLEQDTNLSHTRRLLLLAESRSIYQPELRERLLRAIARRYLNDYDDLTKKGAPRFLLNDVVRYWYTLAVDYQAKRWEGEGGETGWGLRYLKLITSRKVAFAGTLVSLLRCGPDLPATPDYLVEQFDLTPLERLTQLALDEKFTEREALAQALKCAERFAAQLADSDFRTNAKKVQSVHDTTFPEFEEMRQNGDELSEALREVFFGPYLREAAERYLIL